MLDPAALAAQSVNAVFAQWGRDGVWQPDIAAAGIPVRVIVDRREGVADVNAFDSRIRAASVRIEVRRAEIPARPVRGARVSVATERWEVTEDALVLDPAALVWTCQALAIS